MGLASNPIFEKKSLKSMIPASLHNLGTRSSESFDSRRRVCPLEGSTAYCASARILDHKINRIDDLLPWNAR
jgi:hypothetical protein